MVLNFSGLLANLSVGSMSLADPELRERYETLGLAPLGTSPEELATRTQQQFAKYAKVIKDNQIKSD